MSFSEYIYKHIKKYVDNTLPVVPLYAERKYVGTYIKYMGTNFLSRDKSKTGPCRFVRLYTMEKIKINVWRLKATFWIRPQISRFNAAFFQHQRTLSIWGSIRQYIRKMIEVKSYAREFERGFKFFRRNVCNSGFAYKAFNNFMTSEK